MIGGKASETFPKNLQLQNSRLSTAFFPPLSAKVGKLQRLTFCVEGSDSFGSVSYIF